MVSLRTFADYMNDRLYGLGGYYTRGTSQSGREGDYFTAAESGNAFGRLLAEYFIDWQERSQNRPFHLIEVGAGTGKLARAIGESIARFHANRVDCLSYYAVEKSVDRRKQLALAFPTTSGVPFHVFGDLSAISESPLTGCLFANELVDAFPVHRLRRAKGVLEEAYIKEDLGAKPELTWGPLSSPALEQYLRRIGVELPEGYETEVNLAMAGWLKEVAAVLSEGLVVLFDYGRPARELFDPFRSQGTLRGFQSHRVISDILKADGPIDLTADVDFTSLALDAQDAGFQVSGFFDLSAFLLPAVELLTKKGAAAEMPKGLRYLMHPEGMGNAFQVLVLAKGKPFSSWTFDHNRVARLALPERKEN